MTGENHMFQTLILKEGGTMEFGGNQKHKIIGTKLILLSQSIMYSLLMDLDITYLAIVNFMIVVMKWCLIRATKQSSKTLTNP